jgi:integrase
MSKADPIRDLGDVKAIYNRLIKYKYHREAELFLIGCNAALRINDLLKLKFEDIQRITDSHTGKEIGKVQLQETKTRKAKELTLNSVALQSVDKLKAANPEHVYLFQRTSRNASNDAPVSRVYVFKKLKEVAESLSLNYTLSTHSMRKTFGYHAYKQGTDINVLQRLFNHSSVRETFEYIGITSDSVKEVYLNVEITI